MKVILYPSFKESPQALEAEKVLRSCVHCGLCTATCPTYLETGDERDGPRGRIYLIKQLLEQGRATEKTVHHLDRCLTCLSCETACPSRVEYGRLIDIGRGILEDQVKRPLGERLIRWSLRRVIPFRRRFTLVLKLGQIFRPCLPKSLKSKIPSQQSTGPLPTEQHKRRVLILDACAQPGAKPNTNASAARVLDRLGISVERVRRVGCCGALSYHLGAHNEGLNYARQNIDAWWPHLTAGVEAIAVTASGCGSMVKDYGSLLKSDPAYADKALHVSKMTRDLSEILVGEDLDKLNIQSDEQKTAIHCPCTLQHGQKLPTTVDEIMTRVGIKTVPTVDRYSCCGSAGTYSILQSKMSQSLLEKKLQALNVENPDRIVTANIGCQLHLETKAKVPVQHWVEVLDRLMLPE